MGRYAAIDFFLSLVSFHEQVLGAHTFISRAKKGMGIVRGYQMLEHSFRDFHHFRVLPKAPQASKQVDPKMATQRSRPIKSNRLPSTQCNEIGVTLRNACRLGGMLLLNSSVTIARFRA